MTATLLVLVPVALLILVSGFCFVGCVLDTTGTGFDPNKPDPDKPDPKPEPFTTYSKDDVVGHPDIAAYWPLNEPTPPDDSIKLKAHDALGLHDGEYKHKGNAADLYFPCPTFPIVAGVVDSAPAIGSLSLGVESLLPGDAKQPDNDPNILETGMQVNGAFVTVLAASEINPPIFTVEAWVRPEWTPGEAAASRAIVTSQSSDTGTHGFVLWVNNAGNWEAIINDGTSGGSATATTLEQAELNIPSHVVLTFDGTNASIFINGERKAGPSPLPAASSYSPNTVEPLIIGAGFGYLDDRKMGVPDSAFPLVPFNGTIQDVAIYSAVLSDDDIKKHSDDGSGMTTVPG
jgi:hypothetical protein